MATPPTFVAEYESTTWQSGSSPKTVTVSGSVGDVYVCIAATDDSGAKLATPTGGGLTWSLATGLDTVVGFATAYVWVSSPVTQTTVAPWTTGTFTFSLALASGSDLYGFNVLRFSGASGLYGDAKSSNNTGGTPTASLVTTGANSALVAIVAVNDSASGTVTFTGPGTFTLQTSDVFSADHSFFGGWFSDSGAAGANPVALTSPSLTSKNWVISAVELLAFIPPSAPSGQVAPLAETSHLGCHLSWPYPASDGGSPVTGYVLERNIAGAGFLTLATLGAVNEYSDTGLTAGTSYTYRVSPINTIGTGSASSASNAAVPVDLSGFLDLGDGTSHLTLGDGTSRIIVAASSGSTISGAPSLANDTAAGAVALRLAIAGAPTLANDTAAGAVALVVPIISGSPSLADDTATGAVARITPPVISGTPSLANDTAAGAVGLRLTATGAPTLADDVAAGIVTLTPWLISGAPTLAPDVAVGAVALLLTISGAPTLADDTAAGAVALSLAISGTPTLADDTAAGAVARIAPPVISGTPSLANDTASGLMIIGSGLAIVGTPTLADDTAAGSVVLRPVIFGSPTLAPDVAAGAVVIVPTPTISGSPTLAPDVAAGVVTLTGASNVISGAPHLDDDHAVGAVVIRLIISGSPTLADDVAHGIARIGTIEPGVIAMTLAATSITVVMASATITVDQRATSITLVLEDIMDLFVGSQIEITFTCLDVDAVATDPTALVVTVQAGGQAAQPFTLGTSGELVKTATGVYVLTYTVLYPNLHRVRAVATGALVAADQDTFGVEAIDIT